MRLLINADDAGIDAARNRGIWQAAQGGLLRNTSVIVHQDGWKDVCRRLQTERSLSIGLHLNLTAGRPLAKGLKTLVARDGNFFDKFELLSHVFARKIDTAEVEAEFAAQWELFAKQGLKPTHVDGHNHVHILPGFSEAFSTVVPKGSWVRLPMRQASHTVGPLKENPKLIYTNLDRLQKALNFWSVQAQLVWQDRFRHVDDFCGTGLSDAPTFKTFKKEIEDLKGELCELMVHPGDDWDEDSVRFSKLKARQIERDILRSDELKSFLKDRNAKVVTYSELL